MTELVSINITGPADFLAEHTRALVEAKLAACGNIIPSVRSIYAWEGSVEDDAEALLTLHTQRVHVSEIIERTNAAHPYDTVQILAVPIVDADPAYGAWVVEETSPDSGSGSG